MVPSSLATVVAFLLLVAPGILYESLYERRRPSHSTSTFREASRIALASVILSGAALGVLAVVRVIRPSLMPDPGQVLANPSAYAEEHYRLIAATILAGFALALALAWGWDRLRGHGESKSIEPVSAWFKVFRQTAPTGQDPYLRVRLNTGTTYEGVLAHGTPDYEVADRELVLSPPLFVKAGDQPRMEVAQYDRLIIRGSAIVTIFVSYVDSQDVKAWVAASRSAGRQVGVVLRKEQEGHDR